MMRTCHRLALGFTALLLSRAVAAQVKTPPVIRIDTVVAAPLPKQPASIGKSVCGSCHELSSLAGNAPTMIVKDSASRVLAIIPPGDSSYARDPLATAIDPEMIADVRILAGPDAVQALGRGFESGIVVVTLNADGTKRLRAAMAKGRDVPPQ